MRVRPARPSRQASKDLYTFFGRTALEGKPALVLVGGAGEKEPPSWLGKACAELRKPDPKGSGAKESPEAKTRALLEVQ